MLCPSVYAMLSGKRIEHRVLLQTLQETLHTADSKFDKLNVVFLFNKNNSAVQR